MTKFYSKTANGFYDSVIHNTLPKDAIEITEEQWQNFVKDMSNGKILKADKNGSPIIVDYEAPALTVDSCNAFAQIQLEKVAQEWGYNSIVSAASYVNSTNTQFKAEAEALIEWRDKVWAETYTIKAENLPATADAFFALLPKAPIKPVI